ncbi:bifunctional phosphopantothenoylcysteine decarboxylase/phosphopantothenate--cysteine ligase CoaBC [Candidatus Bathyarchaeota archaeon B24-2]|nr:MAG: bifunctional phosphopantothenoylcysteine decarboxylase/phosphopantothenate--cysteine ligase CoaBC [Candidatus Bathyarchaeota archaeon B24-2]
MRFTSKDIVGTKGEELKGRKIVLCLTGSVAVAKAPELARELMRHGAEVYVFMSKAAQELVSPKLMEWATGNPVVTELTGAVEHVAMAGKHPERADLVLVAPATANTIGKMAAGIDDTPVTTLVSTALGSGIPILVAPAMHESMYDHPIVEENIRKLKSIGVWFVGPRLVEGKAKVAEVDEIVEYTIRILREPKDLEGKRVLVTAGPTLEYIDPVRIITNRSSGKMGMAIANEALRRGAEVTVIYGPGTAPPPYGAKVVRVETTEEMHKALVSELEGGRYDVVIAAAAVSDWIPERSYGYKLPSNTLREFTLRLKAAPKLVEYVKRLSPKSFLVAFKAVYRLSVDGLIEEGYRKLVEADADLIVVNDVGRAGSGFMVDTNEVYIVDRDKNVLHVPLSPKTFVAEKILDCVVEKLSR